MTTPHIRFLGRVARLEPLAFETRKTKATELVAAFVAEFGSGPEAEKDTIAFLEGIRDELADHPDASKRASVPAVALAVVRAALKPLEARSAARAATGSGAY